jgi:hypothetical protein
MPEEFRRPCMLQSMSMPKQVELVRTTERRNVIAAEEGHYVVEFKGFVVLGIPYGVMYYRKIAKNTTVPLVNISTDLAGNPNLLSVASRRGVMTEEKLIELSYSDLFDNVAFFEI